MAPRAINAAGERQLVTATGRVTKTTRSSHARQHAAAQSLLSTIELLKQKNPEALVAANVQLLESLQYSISAQKKVSSARIRQPTKVNAICMSFECHDQDSAWEDLNLDHELSQFATFLKQFLDINIRTLKIEKGWAWEQLEKALRRSLKGTDKDTLTIFMYSGHGGADIDKKSWRISSGKGQRLQWNPIAALIEEIVCGQVLVILNSCCSGAAVSSFSKVNGLEILGPEDALDHVAVLTACSFDRITSANGPTTLLKKLARAMSSLLHGNTPLSIAEIYDQISHGSLWCKNQPRLMCSPGASALEIPVDLRDMFSALHRELANHSTTKKFMSLRHEVLDLQTGKEIHVRLKAIIMLSRLPFRPRCRPQCGDKVVAILEQPHKETTREALRDWRKNTSLRKDVAVSLQYFGERLELDAPLLDQVEAIKKANMKGKYVRDNIYRVAVVVEDRDDVFGGVARGCLMSEMCNYAGSTEQGLPCGEKGICESVMEQGAALKRRRLDCTYREPMLERDSKGKWRNLAGEIV